MPNLKQSLNVLKSIRGIKGAAVVDLKSGVTMACTPESVELEIEAAAHADLLKAKIQAQLTLGRKDCIHDILVTTAHPYHLIKMVPNSPGAMICLELDRYRANLGLTKHLVERVLEDMIV